MAAKKKDSISVWDLALGEELNIDPTTASATEIQNLAEHTQLLGHILIVRYDAEQGSLSFDTIPEEVEL